MSVSAAGSVLVISRGRGLRTWRKSLLSRRIMRAWRIQGKAGENKESLAPLPRSWQFFLQVSQACSNWVRPRSVASVEEQKLLVLEGFPLCNPVVQEGEVLGLISEMESSSPSPFEPLSLSFHGFHCPDLTGCFSLSPNRPYYLTHPPLFVW